MGRCPTPKRCSRMCGRKKNSPPDGWRSAMNRVRLLACATALSALVGWSLIAPRPALAQLGSLIVTGAFMKEVDSYAASPDPAHHSTFQAEHYGTRVFR